LFWNRIDLPCPLRGLFFFQSGLGREYIQVLRDSDHFLNVKASSCIQRRLWPGRRFCIYFQIYRLKGEKKMLYLTKQEYETVRIGQLENRFFNRILRAVAAQYTWAYAEKIMTIVETKTIKEASASFDCMSMFKILA